jgi:hypothetical protein
MDSIRAKESSTNDIYINVNDLIIELMVELGKVHTDAEKSAINKIVARLTALRDKSHNKTSGT